MKEHYTRLFEYNLWANKEFSEAVRVNPFENQQILKLISHIANAQVIWLSRLKKEEPSVGVWDEHEVHEALDMLESSSQDWLDYIYSEKISLKTDIDLFIIPDEDVFIENKFMINYQFSPKYTLTGGVKLTQGTYPFGKQLDIFPLIDLSWSWEK